MNSATFRLQDVEIMLSLGQWALWRLHALYATWQIIFSNLVIAVQRIVSECKFASSRQRVSVVICVPLTMITGLVRLGATDSRVLLDYWSYHGSCVFG